MTDFTPAIPRAISEALALAPMVGPSPVSVTTPASVRTSAFFKATYSATYSLGTRCSVAGSRAARAVRRPHQDRFAPARRPGPGESVPSHHDPDPAGLSGRCGAGVPPHSVRFLGCCALRVPCRLLRFDHDRALPSIEFTPRFLPESDVSQGGEYHDADDAEHVGPMRFCLFASSHSSRHGSGRPLDLGPIGDPLVTLRLRGRGPAQRRPHWNVTVLLPSGLTTMLDVIGCEPYSWQ